MERSFVYFVDDNTHIDSVIVARYPELAVEAYGSITVITPRGRATDQSDGSRASLATMAILGTGESVTQSLATNDGFLREVISASGRRLFRA
jgi:hypothetical protein